MQGRGSSEEPGVSASTLPPEILRAIGSFRRRVRSVRALRGLGLTLLVSTVLFFGALSLDRQFVLSPGARLLITAGVFAVAAMSAFVLIALPLLRPLPGLSAARG